ncbi:hypothetical protein CYLTODRAFT_424043 [Cylindrobasidium torrendii FP15055 ss-10]|uniref:F-box domain-containing protein n=1 Tax=Cylindrobasidium torrendii FP15055 ss-10 TaxID=1314674 RepID=A0A0D7B6J9_9AGAR|nr:hypothetical protein CYLTODRAFT_424043 [Cylindrobasidium torrendii FP15055 ss-10]
MHPNSGQCALITPGDFCVKQHASVHALPAELLTIVFHLVLDGTFCIAPQTIGRTGPWALAQVCRVWRELVHNEAGLWMAFYFAYAPHELWRPHYRGLQTALQSVLRLSRHAPLDIIFPSRQDISELLLYDLLADASRWRSVKFVGITDDLRPLRKVARDVSLSPDKIPFERLETVEFKMESILDLEVMEAFRTARNLKHLRLYGYSGQSMSNTVSLVDFPWPQLTHLSINTDFSIITYRLLESCVNLETFHETSHKLSWFSGHAMLPILVHPHIRSLHATDCQLLTLLACPRLEHFSFRASTKCAQEIAEFVRRSASPALCPPTSLEIWLTPHLTPSPSSFVPLLSPFAAWPITHLKIDIRARETVFFKMCSFLAGMPEVLPFLECLGARMDFRRTWESGFFEAKEKASVVKAVAALHDRASARRLRRFSVEVLVCDAHEGWLGQEPMTVVCRRFFSDLEKELPLGLEFDGVTTYDASSLGDSDDFTTVYG